MENRARSADLVPRAELTRRHLLWLALGTAVGTRLAGATTRTDRPLVGAIRWDAWYAPGTEVTSAVERSLSPTRYRWRLPFFAKQDDAGHVHAHPHAGQLAKTAEGGTHDHDAGHTCGACACCCTTVAIMGIAQLASPVSMPQSHAAEPFVLIHARAASVPDKPPRA